MSAARAALCNGRDGSSQISCRMTWRLTSVDLSFVTNPIASRFIEGTDKTVKVFGPADNQQGSRFGVLRSEQVQVPLLAIWKKKTEPYLA